MVIYSPDKISVTQGSSFSVTCSTHSIYPGGVFHLMKSDTKPTETKLAFGHFIFYLANFEFLEINYKDKGEYTCVYAVNISSLSFCSVPSKPLQVTVVGKIQRWFNSFFYSDYSKFSTMLTLDLLIPTAASSSSLVAGVVGGLVLLLVMLVIGYLVWRQRFQSAGRWKMNISFIIQICSTFTFVLMSHNVFRLFQVTIVNIFKIYNEKNT